MHPDVLTIYRFYQSAFGQQVAQLIAGRILQFLPVRPDAVTVGLGYCLPYLDRLAARTLAASGGRFVAFMPARQGVCHWPGHTDNRTCLVEPLDLPLADSSVDHMILVHALEHAARPSALLREIWRVLAPNGHVVIVVPNRLRAWSAAEATPFGHGRPYSKGQLFSVMSDQMLAPDNWDTALAMPPFFIHKMPRLMRFGDKVGAMLSRNLGGALVVHAQKQVYGALPKGSAKAQGVPVLTQSSGSYFKTDT
ncbi:class I SAM-dependent methyltransferase [Kordiimonas pumila]|uniref:Class I SAM-dependent methyltransferase n=1 Tax=Kordiimonas pumila TaxID=2161677 RepID=A0ABV7D058_9PROT|nr:class I SAM-dependent methyltransferase [Kordiimonas pumila]